MTDQADYNSQPRVIGNSDSLQSGALKHLLQYQQADEEGIMVLTSRQAIHEVADDLQALQAENERLREAINWACGCGEATFDPPPNAKPYWWRTHLTIVANLRYCKSTGKYVPHTALQGSE